MATSKKKEVVLDDKSTNEVVEEITIEPAVETTVEPTVEPTVEKRYDVGQHIKYLRLNKNGVITKVVDEDQFVIAVKAHSYSLTVRVKKEDIELI